jgi:aldehyde:ferredoxin oxidoreductase
MFDNTRLEVTGKGEYVKKAAISRMVRDSLIVCTFTPIYTEEMLVNVLSSLSGEVWSASDINEAGLRIMCQERLFNMREGITEKDDTLPARLLAEPKPDGPTKGEVVPLEELKKDYYKAVGYDLSTGNPPDALLDKLGIEK